MIFSISLIAFEKIRKEVMFSEKGYGYSFFTPPSFSLDPNTIIYTFSLDISAPLYLNYPHNRILLNSSLIVMQCSHSSISQHS